MLGCDLGRALLTALVPLSFWVGIPTMPVVYAVTAPIGALSVLFLAAYTAVVPALVGRRQLGQANSYFQALGMVLTGPVSCLLWRLLVPRPRQETSGSAPTQDEGRRGARIGFWPFVLLSTGAFAATGALVTWIWSPPLTGDDRDLAALATIGIAVFNAVSWVLLRLLSPQAVERLGFRR